MEETIFDKMPGLELDKLDIILKIILYIPIICLSIYVLYVLGKGGHHRISEGEWPNSWYITLSEAIKSILFILYPLIGILKILKYILYDILILQAWNRINRVRSILLLITLIVVSCNWYIYTPAPMGSP